jgi:hypothetical protein
MKMQLWRCIAVALLAICAACSNKKEGTETADARVSQDEPAEAAGGAKLTGASWEKQAKDLGKLVDLIVAEAAELPREEFDPAALASKLGKDPQKHFEWVRDHTWWVPYRGLLRGSRGVMLDRVGSNLDRAVLLGDLLRRSGHKVRLAHAELTATRARELLDRVRSLPKDRSILNGIRVPSTERQRAIEAAMSRSTQDLEKQIAESRRVSGEATALVRSQTDAILAAVNGSTSSVQAEEKKAIAALQDHWWVEYEQDGKWIALDVLLPQAEANQKIAEAVSTSNWNPEDETPPIPGSDWHAVGLQIVIEKYEAGVTTEIKVLETTIRPAEVLDRPITLAHVPSPWPENVRFLAAEPNAARVAALTVRKWTPLLQIGRDSLAQSGFTNSGDLKSALTDSTAGLVGDQVTSTMDMALGFGGGEAAPSVTAEWIDYEVKAPGEPTQQLRRPVFDLLGPARRAAKFADYVAGAEGPMLQRAEALLSQTTILLQPCDFTEAFVAHLVSASIVANQAALKELSKEPDLEKARNLASTILDRLETWGPLPNFGRLRSALGGNVGDWFIDRPNVLNHRISQLLVGTKVTSIRQLIDVASNGIGARPGASKNSFEIHVQQGVADTVAEMVALGSDLEAAANTASVFGRLASTNSRGLVVGARDDIAVRQLPWPEDETARIAADVGSGYMVLVPRQSVEIDGEQHVGWWRIDPTSGETIGVMDSGFHGAAEDAALRSKLDALHNKLIIAYLGAGAGGVMGGKGLMDLTSLLLTRIFTLMQALE